MIQQHQIRQNCLQNFFMNGKYDTSNIDHFEHKPMDEGGSDDLQDKRISRALLKLKLGSLASAKMDYRTCWVDLRCGVQSANGLTVAHYITQYSQISHDQYFVMIFNYK